jgi:membrane protein implicated in regulation of membrane protease activity
MGVSSRFLGPRWLALLVCVGLPAVRAEAGAVVGTVKTWDDREMLHVNLRLESTPYNSPRMARLLRSDEQGQFRFDDVPPGIYVLRASKTRWVDVQENVLIPEKDADRIVQVALKMELTPLWWGLAQLQRGALFYAVLIGLAVLLVNYWVAQLPSREIAACGWGVIGLCVAIALVKSLWVEAGILGTVGLSFGMLLTRLGGRAARERVAADEQEVQRQQAKQQEERDNLLAMIGCSGTTLSDLRACGTAEFDGKVFEVRAFDGFVSKGSPVRVRSVDGRTLVVELS